MLDIRITASDSGVPALQSVIGFRLTVVHNNRPWQNPVLELDTDGDGVKDSLDTDADGDGAPDAEEAGPDPKSPVDSDGDGIPDYKDPTVGGSAGGNGGGGCSISSGDVAGATFSYLLYLVIPAMILARRFFRKASPIKAE